MIPITAGTIIFDNKMFKEIERKFLVKKDSLHLFNDGELYRQGYIYTDEQKVIRVRIIGKKGVLTIKNKVEKFSKDEFEYEIPVFDAEYMLENLCSNRVIEKYRTKILVKNQLWEVDRFIGLNEGLLIAEIELQAENQIIDKPEWIGEEVTMDKRYYNSYLASKPFTTW